MANGFSVSTYSPSDVALVVGGYPTVNTPAANKF